MSEREFRRPSLTSRIAHVLRPRKLRNGSLGSNLGSQLPVPAKSQDRTNYHDVVCGKPNNDNICEQTGERRDMTDLLHGLSHYGSFDSLDSTVNSEMEERRRPGESDIAKLPSQIWKLITNYMSICDIMCLAISTKTLLRRIDQNYWHEINHHKHREQKIRFLSTMDSRLPHHLLCFSCAIFHSRTKIGKEYLKSSMVYNPIYNCNGLNSFGYEQPKTRLTSDHFLPFNFLQLATRAQRYSLEYGIPLENLSRRYKERNADWFHQTRYQIHKGHLLLRVVSWTYAAPGLPPSGQRHLLYSRVDYWPYFSCCEHWRDGELMDICKCALAHIPENPQTRRQRSLPTSQKTQNSPLIGTLCSFCGPMRRCPRCPTEYMVELRLSEDRSDPRSGFKQSIVVTRWSDLGDGLSPFTAEWSAINNETEYDSFEHLGKRAISGVFESQSGVTMPAQRLISTNPKNEKHAEERDDWY